MKHLFGRGVESTAAAAAAAEGRWKSLGGGSGWRGLFIILYKFTRLLACFLSRGQFSLLMRLNGMGYFSLLLNLFDIILKVHDSMTILNKNYDWRISLLFMCNVIINWYILTLEIFSKCKSHVTREVQIVKY